MNYLKTGDREAILKKKRVVVKVGTSSITYENGKVNFRYLDHLTRQLADLKNRGLDVVLVTSGAIGVGLPMLGFHKKPDFLPYKQAAAAVGQGALGIEFREDRKDLAEMLSFMEPRPTSICVEA